MSENEETGIAVVTPEAQGAVDRAESFAETFTAEYAVTCGSTYAAAGGTLKGIKAKAKELDALRKSLTKPLDESKARIMDLFRGPLECLKGAEGHVKRAMLAYEDEQEAKRKAEEDRLRELQRKETERLERLEREARQRVIDAAEAGDAKKAAKDAAKAEAFAGRAETAKAAPVTVARTFDKVDGVSRTKTWAFEVENVDLIPRKYMTPDMVALGKIARATAGSLQIPGVRFYAKHGQSARAD